MITCPCPLLVRIPPGTLDSFVWGSYPTSLRNVGGSTKVPARVWNNALRGTCDLPPPVKLQCWCDVKPNPKHKNGMKNNIEIIIQSSLSYYIYNILLTIIIYICNIRVNIPGTAFTPHHQKRGRHPWWNTCRNVTWLFFLRKIKNTCQIKIK